MSLEIITLSPDEWTLYKALRLEALLNEPQAFGTPYANMADRPDAFFRGRLEEAAAGENSWLLFAREAGKLVGMVGAFRAEERDKAEIVSVYVTPSARGRGISRLLMAALLEKLAQVGIRRAVLGVTAGQDAAVRLYQRFGFTVVGSYVLTLGDGLEHAVIQMERYL